MAKNNLSFKLALLVQEFFKKNHFLFLEKLQKFFLYPCKFFSILTNCGFFQYEKNPKESERIFEGQGRIKIVFPKYVKWLFFDRFSNTVRTVLSGKKISKLTKVLEPHLAKLKVSLPKPLFSTALNAKKRY